MSLGAPGKPTEKIVHTFGNKNYYEVLGVTRDANADLIKKTYRDLALNFHPDRNPGDVQAEENFKKVSEAYETLSDPKRRAEYDETLRARTEATINAVRASAGSSLADIFRVLYKTPNDELRALSTGAEWDRADTAERLSPIIAKLDQFLTRHPDMRAEVDVVIDRRILTAADFALRIGGGSSLGGGITLRECQNRLQALEPLMRVGNLTKQLEEIRKRMKLGEMNQLFWKLNLLPNRLEIETLAVGILAVRKLAAENPEMAEVVETKILEAMKEAVSLIVFSATEDDSWNREKLEGYLAMLNKWSELTTMDLSKSVKKVQALIAKLRSAKIAG